MHACTRVIARRARSQAPRGELIRHWGHTFRPLAEGLVAGEEGEVGGGLVVPAEQRGRAIRVSVWLRHGLRVCTWAGVHMGRCAHALTG